MGVEILVSHAGDEWMAATPALMNTSSGCSQRFSLHLPRRDESALA